MVLGAMLMLLIMATLYGTIQAYHVPIWNKDVEFEHLDVVHDDLQIRRGGCGVIRGTKVQQHPDGGTLSQSDILGESRAWGGWRADLG